VLDMFDGQRIDYLPGAGWRSSLPSAFFGTMAALTAAWLGAVPLHACAVEMHGRAFLIAGRTGAGKSTLAAALIGRGASLVGDDLTVVRATGDSAIEVFTGRPTMRLHAAAAAAIASQYRAPIDDDRRGKWLVRPVARTLQGSLPLGGILVLRPKSGRSAKLSLLAHTLFRPRWLAALPNYPLLRRDLLTVSSAAPARSFPEIGKFDPAAQAARTERAMALLHEMTES
jgi:hypothetical protein